MSIGIVVALLIPYPEEGTYAIGNTGMGKSSFLARRMLEDYENNRGFVLIDPKEDLADFIYRHIGPVRVLDVRSANFGVNMFSSSGDADVDLTLDRVMQVFNKVFGVSRDFTARLRNYVRMTASLLIQTNGTMADMSRTLMNRAYRDTLLRQIDDQTVLEFWAYHESLSSREKSDRIESTYNRILEFMGTAISREIFGAKENTVDWVEVMDSGVTILVRLSSALSDLSSLVGAVIMAQLAAAAFSRGDRSPYSIYCDEYHRFATPATDDLLTQGRSFGISTTVAHQYRDQLDTHAKGATLQCGNILVFRVSPPDNDELAGLFEVEEEEGRIIGRIAKQTYDPDPVHTLIHKSHKDQDGQLVSRRLRDIEVRGLGGSLVDADARDPLQLSNLDRTKHLPVFQQINTYWVRVMQGSLTLGSDQELLAIAWCVLKICEFPGMSLGQGDWERKWFKQNEFDAVKMYSASVISMGDKDIHRVLATVGGFTNDEALFIHKTIYWLQKMARSLLADPLMVDTHQFEEVRERSRSVEDRISENANRLANLPRGSAFVKLRSATGYYQDVVALAAPPDPIGPAYVSEPFVQVKRVPLTFYSSDQYSDEPPEQ